MNSSTPNKRKRAEADVENYAHDKSKRINIPTSENQGLVRDDDKAVRTLLYPRNPDLDPQLVWRGKDDEDLGEYLRVASPPIYIQEKIHPRAVVEDLKRRTREQREEEADQFNFFADFNGLPEGWEADPTDSYYHDKGNWQNRMILGDALLVMASLADREGLRGQVQCIYIDPPYGIKFNSNWQPSTKSRDVSNTARDSLTREPEVVRAFRDTWSDGINSYLSYLRDRLTVSRDLLASSGSIFVQIGDENLHRVRALLDEVFGTENAVSVICIRKTGGQETSAIPNVSDFILWYAKDVSQIKYRQLYHRKELGIGEGSGQRYDRLRLVDGASRPLNQREREGEQSIPEGARAYQLTSLISSGVRTNTTASWTFQGREYHSGQTSNWKTSLSGLSTLAKADRIEARRSTIAYVRFIDDFSAYPLSNIWTDVAGASGIIYVVQTSTTIVQRCILMTTDPGDLVLDPTCGSGTTAFVAEQWGRRWITIDTSRVALALARARLMGGRFDWYLLRDSEEGAAKEGELTGRAPDDGPFANDIRQGFIYERAPHITLKSIANNAEIDVIWERWQKTLEPLRAALNDVAATSWEDWQIPFASIYPWEERAAAKLHQRIRDLSSVRDAEEAADEPNEKALKSLDRRIGKALSDLNRLLKRDYTLKTLPEHAGDSLPDAAIEPHAKWWGARRSRQTEIDESIARNAEVEPLVDRPYVARGVVRVSGPFTVESLSPHRVLPVEDDPNVLRALLGDEDDIPPAPSPSTEETDFAQVVYENLKTSGVQNTKKGERLEFIWLRPFASKRGYIQFEGRYEEDGEERRAAITIGPEYGTVGYDLVRNAAREAVDLFDTLVLCGFAFAPEVDDSRLNLGNLNVLKAHMNQDLRMGEKLKSTGAGNLFVVFGEPDIVVEEAGDGIIRVEIKGVDIFDPTTGEVRSSQDPAEDIACWFIDDDYNEESFFVRQAYFLGNADPYDALRRTLKANIDEAAWEELNSTVSMPFPRPDSGRICVKVINHFGDEVQKVFDV